MNTNLFSQRASKHDEAESKVMSLIRPFTDRKHLPDRRVSFANTPMSFDVKTNIFVEDNARNEYFRLWNEDGELVFIVYSASDEPMADWIINLDWSGPYPPSARSTTGDEYYKIGGGRTLSDFLSTVYQEVKDLKSI